MSSARVPGVINIPLLTFYAGGLPHFTDHLAPIYLALPEDVRGGFYCRGRAAVRANQLGIEPAHPPYPPKKADCVVVASFEDYVAVNPAPVVLVNHGVGQTYHGDPKSANHSSYSGGKNRDRVILNLCPSQRDADNCDGPTAVIGTPRLDPWHREPIPGPVVGELPVVAVSFHADIQVCPETRWAFPHFRSAIQALATDPTIRIVGHSHPRSAFTIERFFHRAGVPFFANFSDVLDVADLYVADNSSTLYEFASTGRPVLVLNAPWYRRNIHHGLRFWDAIPGVECDHGDDLRQAISLAVSDPTICRQTRRRALDIAYHGATLDGHSTQRAVEALLAL